MGGGWRSLESLRNRNVRVALGYTATYALSNGLWGNTVLSGYLKSIPPHSNLMVGTAEGLQGMMQVAAALPVGAVADRVGRQRVLRYSAGVGLAAIVLVVSALMYGAVHDQADGDATISSGRVEFVLMCIALSLFGAFDGSRAGSLEAIYHDSIKSSERQSMATIKFVLQILCFSSGPTLSAVLFYGLGDDWTRTALRAVCLVGVCMAIFPMLALLQFRDSAVLGHESEAVGASPMPAAANGSGTHGDYTAIANGDGDGDGDGDEAEVAAGDGFAAEIGPGTGDDRAGTGLEEALLPGEGAAAAADSEGALAPTKALGSKYFVPRIVLAGDVCFGLASGVTIKYFPLFFKEETGLTPAQVNWIYVLSPLVLVVFSLVADRAAKRFGRVVVPLCCSGAGILLLYVMVWMGLVHDKLYWKTPHIIVPIFVARTAFMNCCSAVRKSILIDFVDKEQRAWWNSMDSITRFSWSGSAVLGGFLCDHYGYGASFILTAALQSCALLVFSTLLLFKKRIDPPRTPALHATSL